MDSQQRIIFNQYDFNYLGFEVSIYPSSQKGMLTILVNDPLRGTTIHSYESEQITAMAMDFAMNKVREVIAHDEL